MADYSRKRAINDTFHGAMASAVLAVLTSPLFAFGLGAVPVAFAVLMTIFGFAMIGLILDSL